MVSGGSSAGRTDRPDRPDLPTSVVASRDRQVESSEAVPLAEPVVIQGVTRIVLLGFVLFLLVMGAILIMMYVRSYR